MKIEMKYLVLFKVYFHIFSIFRTGCLSTSKNPIRFHPHKIQFTKDKILAIHLNMIIIDADILKHEDRGAKRKKQCRKEEKHRSSHLKMFWEQGVLEIKKK